MACSLLDGILSDLLRRKARAREREFFTRKGACVKAQPRKTTEPSYKFEEKKREKRSLDTWAWS
jgi:hypothetical protein